MELRDLVMPQRDVRSAASAGINPPA